MGQGTNPLAPWPWASQPPELWELLFKPLHLWYFVIATQAKTLGLKKEKKENFLLINNTPELLIEMYLMAAIINPAKESWWDAHYIIWIVSLDQQELLSDFKWLRHCFTEKNFSLLRKTLNRKWKYKSSEFWYHLAGWHWAGQLFAWQSYQNHEIHPGDPSLFSFRIRYCSH